MTFVGHYCASLMMFMNVSLIQSIQENRNANYFLVMLIYHLALYSINIK